MILLLQKIRSNFKAFILPCAIICVGLFFRLYHIEFGLPQSFYADEPEISEPAIKYTYELKDILQNNNYYKLIPISYVYGTLPTYFFTICVMTFSKFMNVAGITFDKTTLFIFMRVVNAVVSMLIPILGAYLACSIYKNKSVTLTILALITFNWKLIVHAHYLNQDMFLTVLLLATTAMLFKYYISTNTSAYTLYTTLSGIIFGFAVGTKITALISIPVVALLFVKKKDLYGLVGFGLLALGSYALTNPFSVLFFQDFIFRVYRMTTVEAGLVFDSVDSNPVKYIWALVFTVTPLLAMLSFYGKFISLKKRDANFVFHIFLMATVLVYFFFFSIQSRRVDRWLLPILPVLLVYAGYGIVGLLQSLTRVQKIISLIVISLLYLYFPILLLWQFGRYTPKSEAYLWSKQNLPALAKKLVYTEEGLDPMNKLDGAKVYQFEVYESKGAQFFSPDPLLASYNYVIISSRPMQNFKRKEVRTKYPVYAQNWDSFEKTLNDETKYEVIKEFVLPKPNLIPLSDVYIYKKL